MSQSDRSSLTPKGLHSETTAISIQKEDLTMYGFSGDEYNALIHTLADIQTTMQTLSKLSRDFEDKKQDIPVSIPTIRPSTLERKGLVSPSDELKAFAEAQKAAIREKILKIFKKVSTTADSQEYKSFFQFQEALKAAHL